VEHEGGLVKLGVRYVNPMVNITLETRSFNTGYSMPNLYLYKLQTQQTSCLYGEYFCVAMLHCFHPFLCRRELFEKNKKNQADFLRYNSSYFLIL